LGVSSNMPTCEKAKHISKCLELAILLEVSTHKPGNVNFVVGFEGTRVEHFLASAVAAAPSFEEAARRGIAVSNGKLALNKVGLGQLIRDCVADIDAWQKGGNTLIGTVMLFIPMAVAAGMTPFKDNKEYDEIDIRELKKNIKLVVEETTPQDAVRVYDSISIAKPSGLNGSPDLDVKDSKSKERLLKENVSLYQVFKIAASYDDVCSEFVNNYPTTFDMAFPYLMEQLLSKGMTTAIVNTFLKILAEHPDTFIARKVGVENAYKISLDAKQILQEGGGVATPKGKELTMLLDKKLREYGNNYNPGTTADITAATIALCTLSGYRP
jgi:triphosphoribosyl-dephospho-CoA synthase